MVEEKTNFYLPPSSLWESIAKLSIVEDKPIMLDYWTESLEKKVVIGIKENSDERLLVKNSEEYTSPIVKLLKSENVLIICTENSLYLVSADIKKKYIKN